MTNKNANKNQIIEAARKIVAAKKDVIAYSNKEISKKQLNDRGTKLAMPLSGISGSRK
jgi:thiazole synthase ThiGH ThiG subunit